MHLHWLLKDPIVDALPLSKLQTHLQSSFIAFLALKRDLQEEHSHRDLRQFLFSGINSSFVLPSSL